VRIVGAGYALPDPARLAEALGEVNVVIARTLEHPGLAEALGVLDVPVIACDDLYAASASFDECYERIVERVADLARVAGRAGYVVPGSPLVAERTVGMLAARNDLEVEIGPSEGVLDAILARLGLDPAVGMCVVDARALLGAPSAVSGTVVVLQAFDPDVAGDVAALGERWAGRTLLVHHLGLADEWVGPVEVGDAHLGLADQLTSVVLEEYRPSVGAVGMLDEVVRRLRVACPWDASQTHETLSRHLIEEAYEVAEAIDEDARGEVPTARTHLVEELGDVLLQVLMQAVIAEERGAFDLAEIADACRAKLIRRHPHVFGDQEATSPEEVEARWEAIKAAEQPGMRPVATGLPAALRLAKLARRARAAGIEVGAVSGSDRAAELARAALAGEDLEGALRAATRLLEDAVARASERNGPGAVG